MKIVCISDTHQQHNYLNIPNCDLLIHCGDFTNLGKNEECYKFIEWLKTLTQVKNIVFIPGNHDFLAQEDPSWFYKRLKNTNIQLLIDEYTIIDGLKIYGTPWTPFFYNWAFNGVDILQNIPISKINPPLEKIFEKIPIDTDILLCHGPPKGILDQVIRPDLVENVGSLAIAKRIESLKNLKYYICGHIHGMYGKYYDMEKRITYINASISPGENKNKFSEPIIINI